MKSLSQFILEKFKFGKNKLAKVAPNYFKTFDVFAQYLKDTYKINIKDGKFISSFNNLVRDKIQYCEFTEVTFDKPIFDEVIMAKWGKCGIDNGKKEPVKSFIDDITYRIAVYRKGPIDYLSIFRLIDFKTNNWSLLELYKTDILL